MTNEFRKNILDALLQTGIVKAWEETECSSENIEFDSDIVNVSESDEDIATSSDGIQYSKKEVNKYLTYKGYPLTQENIDMVAKMFKDGFNTSFTHTSKRLVNHNEIENLSDEELNLYINSKILKLLIPNAQKYEYKVVKVKDKDDGSTNSSAIESELNKYGSIGWRLKNVFTNELGVNSKPLIIGNISINQTINEVVLVFERIKLSE